MGCGNKIKNIYENKTTESGVGLFAYISGIVKNLTVTGNIIGASDQGGIATENDGIIQNCHSEVILKSKVNDDVEVGGIVGRNKGKIEKCYNSGNIVFENSSWLYGGGIVGVNEGEIKKCYNLALIDIKAQRAYSGGIVGYNTANVNECYNLGKIEGTGSYAARIGGISGSSQLNNATVENCYNKGNVETKQGTVYAFAGGIIGNNVLTVNNCYNIGKVSGVGSGYARIGGVFGNASGTINNCYYLNSSVESGLAYGNVNGTVNESKMLTESEMELESFVDMLDNNLDTKKWKKDEKNINNGYPILNWQ